MTPPTRKISHALSVMSSADEMRLEEFICDFKINAGSKTFNVHRLILATNSGYFRSLISSNMAEAQRDYVTMEGIESTIMQQCIEYMYTSDCTLRPESVSTILHAANYLQISTLENNCFEYLQENLCPANSLDVLNLARTFNHEDVAKSADDMVMDNLELVISSELFQQIMKQDLFRYIANSNYKVTWTAMTTWCEGNKDEFLDLAKNLDYPNFPFNFLLETVLEHPLVEDSENVKSIVIGALFTDSSRLSDNLNIKNCFSLKKMAIDRQSEQVIVTFMNANFSSLTDEPEFCSLSKREVMCLLKSPDVEPEVSKWQAILRWVKKDEGQRDKHFVDLFRSLDLTKFPLEFLKETVRQESLVQADSTCMGLLVDVLISQADGGKPKTDSPTALDEMLAQALHLEQCSDDELLPWIAHLPEDKEIVASGGDFSVSSHSRKSSASCQTDTKMANETRNTRGREWTWERLDGYGWVKVNFDKGGRNNYRMEAEGKFDDVKSSSASGSLKSSTAAISRPQQTCKRLKPGTRVVRGPDWEYGDQDGNGEGAVIENLEGSGDWVVVCWDKGEICTYRMGFDEKYDLTEVVSTGITSIDTGIDRHHQHRPTSTASTGITSIDRHHQHRHRHHQHRHRHNQHRHRHHRHRHLSSSDSSEDSSESEDNVKERISDAQMDIGTRVVRARDWKWSNQGGNAKGTIVGPAPKKGWVRVKWDKGETKKYRMGAEGKFDLVKSSSASGSSDRRRHRHQHRHRNRHQHHRHRHLSSSDSSGDSSESEEMSKRGL